MTEIEVLQEKVKSLSENEFTEFRDWFVEYEHDIWDKQIQSDFQSGKFHNLIHNAKKEYNDGKAQEL